MTLLVNAKTYEKVVLHMTVEGAKSQGRSPVKSTRIALAIGRCCINQQSQLWRGLQGTGTRPPTLHTLGASLRLGLCRCAGGPAPRSCLRAAGSCSARYHGEES